jgi:integrase
MVFRFGIATGRAERDPAADLRGALITPKVKHYAAIIDPVGIGGLLRSIAALENSFIVRTALLLAALTFVRPGELRFSEWVELDLKAAVWRIPASKMKMKREHRVPLARQTVELLRELHSLTGSSKYLFPSARSWKRPISENTLNAALRRLGYNKDEMTAHGFRSMASSQLNEMGLWNPDAIERQLAHQEANDVRRAYMHGAEFWNDRVKMMQAWADRLDELRAMKPGHLPS